jgi:hypothetical protein
MANLTPQLSAKPVLTIGEQQVLRQQTISSSPEYIKQREAEEQYEKEKEQYEKEKEQYEKEKEEYEKKQREIQEHEDAWTLAKKFARKPIPSTYLPPLVKEYVDQIRISQVQAQKTHEKKIAEVMRETKYKPIIKGGEIVGFDTGTQSISLDFTDIDKIQKPIPPAPFGKTPPGTYIVDGESYSFGVGEAPQRAIYVPTPKEPKETKFTPKNVLPFEGINQTSPFGGINQTISPPLESSNEIYSAIYPSKGKYEGDPYYKTKGEATFESFLRIPKGLKMALGGLITEIDPGEGFRYIGDPWIDVSRKDDFIYGLYETAGTLEKKRLDEFKKKYPDFAERIEKEGVQMAMVNIQKDISKSTLPIYQNYYKEGVFTEEQAQKEYEREINKRIKIAFSQLGEYKPVDLTYSYVPDITETIGNIGTYYALGPTYVTVSGLKTLSEGETIGEKISGAVMFGLGLYGSSQYLKGIESSWFAEGQKALQKKPVIFGEVQSSVKNGKSVISLYGERVGGGLKESFVLSGNIEKISPTKYIMPGGRGTSIVTGDLSFLSKGGEQVKLLTGQEFILGQKGVSFTIKEGELFTSLSRAKVFPTRGMGTIFREGQDINKVAKQLSKSATIGGKEFEGVYLGVSAKVGKNLYLSRGGKVEDVLIGKDYIEFTSPAQDIGLTKVVKTKTLYDFYPSGDELLLKGNIQEQILTPTQTILQDASKSISAVKNIPKITSSINSLEIGGITGSIKTIIEKPTSAYAGLGLYERTEETLSIIPKAKTSGFLISSPQKSEFLIMRQSQTQKPIQKLLQAPKQMQKQMQKLLPQKPLQAPSQTQSQTQKQMQKQMQKLLQAQKQTLGSFQRPRTRTPSPSISGFGFTPPPFWGSKKEKEYSKKKLKVEKRKREDRLRKYQASVGAVSLGIYSPKKYKTKRKFTGLELRPIISNKLNEIKPKKLKKNYNKMSKKLNKILGG